MFVFILAPIVKKPGASAGAKYGSAKSGTSIGKISGPKVALTPSKVPSVKPATVPATNKISFGTPSTSSKTSAPYSYANPKTSKSTTFGIIWLPSRKHNKKKDIVHNSQRQERYNDRGPSMYNFMSGDSHYSNKKEEDTEKDLLVPSRIPPAIVGAGATAAVVEPAVITSQPEEKQEFINPHKNKEDPKETPDELKTNEKENSKNSENIECLDKSSDGKSEQDSGDKGDNVDSVYLRPPPAHKARSNTSTPAAEDEDCGIKCLYYTLQCCDCVLM